MSDTPLTDAEECEIIPSRDPDYSGPHLWVESKFCRKFERMNNSLLATLESILEVAEDREDIEDSNRGPRPNIWMSIAEDIRTTISKRYK